MEGSISDFLALERKARLTPERSAGACAGLKRKSQKIGRPKGMAVDDRRFHAAIFMVSTPAGFRSVM